MEKIKVRHQGARNIYVHNDLFAAADHFKNAIEAKLKADDRKGIAYEYMACMVMLAFTVEARMNFLGHKLIRNWNERQGFDKKLDEVFKQLGVVPDWENRPYKSIANLKVFRDSIAHGKPLEVEFDETLEGPADEIDRLIDLNSEWTKYCQHEIVFDTFNDLQVVWDALLRNSGLTVFDTITHGSSGLTYVEKIIDT